MRAKIAQSWAAVTADDTTTRILPLLAKLIQHKTRETGSKMTAYARIAAKVGGSASWLRKLLGRQPNVDLAAHQYLNILSLYRRLCERLETEAENERAKLEILWSQTDASLQGDFPMGAAPDTPASRSDQLWDSEAA